MVNGRKIDINVYYAFIYSAFITLSCSFITDSKRFITSGGSKGEHLARAPTATVQNVLHFMQFFEKIIFWYFPNGLSFLLRKILDLSLITHSNTVIKLCKSQKRSKIKRQISKKIVAFVFAWCYWALTHNNKIFIIHSHKHNSLHIHTIASSGR